MLTFCSDIVSNIYQMEHFSLSLNEEDRKMQKKLLIFDWKQFHLVLSMKKKKKKARQPQRLTETETLFQWKNGNKPE